MIRKPKIFIGTMACGEAEFDLCKQAISNQVGVVVTHSIFENLPELEAHQNLLSIWNRDRASYDLFIKVDADTVLDSPEALLKLWHKFEADSDLTAIQTGLLDYYTNKMIAGLNCFTPDVSFEIPTDPLYCDRIKENGHRKILRIDDTLDIYPIARHCINPSPEQSFHFGYRRWMKGQVQIIEDCLKAWTEKPEAGRLWSLAGARAAFFKPSQDASYSSEEFKLLFKTVEKEINSSTYKSSRTIEDIKKILTNSLSLRLKRLMIKPNYPSTI